MHTTNTNKSLAWRESVRREQYVKAKILIAEIEAQWEYDKNSTQASGKAEPVSVDFTGEDPLLTKAEAAKAMSVSASTLSRLRKKGTLKPVKRLLPMVRYRYSDLQKIK